MNIYNLEFRPYINELKIGGYTFRRVDNYEERFKSLQHFVAQTGSEYSVKPTTGGHQHTAIVLRPKNEIKSNLSGLGDKATELDDILLLLSIFTGREVFIINGELDGAIIRDPRLHTYGGNLRCSVRYKRGYMDISKNKYVEQDELDLGKVESCDIGFEETLNAILQTIRSNEWKNKYRGGYFLSLYRQATLRNFIEINFIMCWTIWEHLFSIHNSSRLTEEKIYKMSGEEKISFMFAEYFSTEISKKSHTQIKKIARARNRIVHYGEKSEDVPYEDMDLFIRATEYIVARTLNLNPSDVFNVDDRVAKFLCL